jgi:hypothetical protein
MDSDYILAPIYYFGGFVLAAICVICAFLKGAKEKYWAKSAKLLWIAAVLFVLGQIALWIIAVETGNGI